MFLSRGAYVIGRRSCLCYFFFFNDTATTEIYTLSLHDALPIGPRSFVPRRRARSSRTCWRFADRKSTRLNSSHGSISYAVFFLKKKKRHKMTLRPLIRLTLIRTAKDSDDPA